METALTIMFVQALLGLFDTLYFHECKYRLPTHGLKVRGELRLHSVRDFVYGILFLTLPFVKWQGYLAYVLCLLIALEVCITIWDFNIEVVERADIGGVANEERGLHLVMAVVYGFFLAHLLPHIISWSSLATTFGAQDDVAAGFRVLFIFFGLGVILSGIRDLAASYEIGLFQKDLFNRATP